MINGKGYTVVVDFSRGSIKMAAAESACEAVRFRGITQLDFAQDADDPEDQSAAELAWRIGDEVRRRGWSGMRAACLLSRTATSTQSFLFPPMPDPELRQAIALKLRDTLHFDVEEASFDFRRLRTYGSGGDERVLTLVAVARRDEIRRAVGILRESGLRPVAIGAAAESLASLALGACLCKEDEAMVHVDVGSGSTILNMFDGQSLRFSREIDVAGDSFTHALMRPILLPDGVRHLTEEQAESIKAVAGYPLQAEGLFLADGITGADILPLMEPVLQRLSAEIRRSMDYLCGLTGRDTIDRIVLSGPSGEMRNLDLVLSRTLEVPVKYNDPVARSMAHWRLAICDENPPSPAAYAAILGYSLGGHMPINLLPKEERIEQRIERLGQLHKAAAIPAVGLAVALGMGALPAVRDYGKAGEALTGTVAVLEGQLGELETRAAHQAADLAVAERLIMERGVVADWGSVLKELSSLMSEEAKIVSFNVIREAIKEDDAESLVLDLGVRIEPMDRSFNEISTGLTIALNASPFFADVHVIQADSRAGEGIGRLEVVVHVVAGCVAPWRSQQ